MDEPEIQYDESGFPIKAPGAPLLLPGRSDRYWTRLQDRTWKGGFGLLAILAAAAFALDVIREAIFLVPAGAVLLFLGAGLIVIEHRGQKAREQETAAGYTTMYRRPRLIQYRGYFPTQKDLWYLDDRTGAVLWPPGQPPRRTFGRLDLAVTALGCVAVSVIEFLVLGTLLPIQWALPIQVVSTALFVAQCVRLRRRAAARTGPDATPGDVLTYLVLIAFGVSVAVGLALTFVTRSSERPDEFTRFETDQFAVTIPNDWVAVTEKERDDHAALDKMISEKPTHKMAIEWAVRRLHDLPFLLVAMHDYRISRFHTEHAYITISREAAGPLTKDYARELASKIARSVGVTWPVNVYAGQRSGTYYLEYAQGSGPGRAKILYLVPLGSMTYAIALESDSKRIDQRRPILEAVVHSFGAPADAAPSLDPNLVTPPEGTPRPTPRPQTTEP